jgi:YwqJ-like deaminase
MSESDSVSWVVSEEEAARIHMVPCVSGGLLLNGTVTSHTSAKGVGDAVLHPLIDEFLREIPVEHREMFRFNCAEAILVSGRLVELEDSRADAAPLTWDEAVEHCTGGTVFLRLVRDPTDPENGAATVPCKSCAHLLTALGIEVLAS